ncbi:mitochondrial Homoaconitase [Allomyces arbusculus]|nr:mitochondrial Homoaconitase [Allomyces arbusculus]
MVQPVQLARLHSAAGALPSPMLGHRASALLSARTQRARLISTSPRLFAAGTGSAAAPGAGQTVVEKIAQRYAVGLAPNQVVRAGDFVYIQPHHVMTHDNTGAVMAKFQAIGATKMADPHQPVFALDHDVQNRSDKNLDKYTRIEQFAKQHGVDFYPAGRGIGHQVMVEEGYIAPYSLTVASDSHSNMYGGVGCLGTPVVRTDAAAIWATGRTWWQVPPVVQVALHGKPRPGVSGKDVILALCAYFSKDQVLNTAIEFVGDGVRHLSVDERLAVANMTTEWGALAGVFPVDELTLDYLSRQLRARRTPIASPRLTRADLDHAAANPVLADGNAFYTKQLDLDLTTVRPFVSGPNSVKVTTAIDELAAERIPINKAYLLSCVNARQHDLAEAARIVRAAGPSARVAPGVEWYVAPASTRVQQDAEAAGDWQTLMAAGAIALPAGCGPCVGLGRGLLEDGEVGISATNRNFKGRMGSPSAKAYLASPAVVTASALKGHICAPDLPEYAAVAQGEPLRGSVREFDAPERPAAADASASETALLPGFPATLKGELLYVHQNNLNTDGIYPGKYTYQDDMTAAQMANVVMENYDTGFAQSVADRRAQGTDSILLAGFNFGTGSSREQAATALLAAGIRLVLAGSASETFKRNALNNGLLVLEAPALVRDAAAAFGAETLTKATGWEVEVRLAEGVALVMLPGESKPRRYAIPAVGMAAQELVVEGGLENWIRSRLQ